MILDEIPAEALKASRETTVKVVKIIIDEI